MVFNIDMTNSLGIFFRLNDNVENWHNLTTED